MARYNPLDIYLDGRWVVSGKVGHLHMGNPISLAESISSVLNLIPSLQANPYTFVNGITPTALLPLGSGTEVSLGGIMNRNTILNGIDDYSFTFDNLLNFSINTVDYFAFVDNSILNVVGNTLENLVSVRYITVVPEYIVQSNQQVIMTNSVFNDCNELSSIITSSKNLGSFQLGDYNGHKLSIYGDAEVESQFNPPALIPVTYESGFYTSTAYQDACVPRSFINSYFKANEGFIQLESSSLIEVNIDAVTTTVKKVADAGEDDFSTITQEANSVVLLVHENITGASKESVVEITSREISIKNDDGLTTSEYLLPTYQNPNDGEFMVMDSASKGRFTRLDYLIQVPIDSIGAGDFIDISIHFDPQVYFKYYLDRVMFMGNNGTNGDSLTFFLQDFQENTLTGGPVTINLSTLNNIHPSVTVDTPGRFFVSTSNAFLNTCEHDGQPTMWTLRVSSATLTTSWTKVNVSLVFKLKTQ